MRLRKQAPLRIIGFEGVLAYKGDQNLQAVLTKQASCGQKSQEAVVSVIGAPER